MNDPEVTLDRPWLRFDLGEEMRVLSWALNKPGFVTARRILWREVRNADLPRDLDVHAWLARILEETGETDSVAFLTSRNIDAFLRKRCVVGDTAAEAVVTVGLSNAERVGLRRTRSHLDVGTINIAVRVTPGLSETGLLEAMSVAVQARTAAVLDADIDMETGRATGTGTDCVAIAAPPGSTDYAGLHTDVGEAVGRVVYDAVLEGALAWKAEQTKA
ncbi:MAG: adenosylcobinamide amidohydrolase [Paracoccaceae bacterium]